MIKNIIFDFAGVLTTQRCFIAISQKLSEKYGVDYQKIKEKLYENPSDILLGIESTKDFWEKYLKDLSIPYEGFVEVFKSWYELDPRVLELIKKLPEYRYFIISDNFDVVTPIIRNEHKLNELFEKIYFSNELNLSKKSGKSIYEFFLSENNIIAEECIFIDDKKRNVEAASNLGMISILFENFNDFEKGFRRILSR